MITDSCPACCRRGVRPLTTRWRGASIVHGYRCPACRHRWATTRHRPAYTNRPAA